MHCSSWHQRGPVQAEPPPSPAQKAVIARHCSPCLIFPHRYAFSTQHPGPCAKLADQPPFALAQHPSMAPRGPTTKRMLPSTAGMPPSSGLTSSSRPILCLLSLPKLPHRLPAPHSYPALSQQGRGPTPVISPSLQVSARQASGESLRSLGPRNPTRSHPCLSPPCSPHPG